jgi:sensor c-di-GMP phosphodiesterase-like protein
MLLGLLSMATLLTLAYVIVAAEFNRDLQTTVAAAVTNADYLFEKVVAELDKLSELSDAPCNDHTLQALQQAVYRAPEIREIGLVRDGSLLYCTNFGPAEVDLSSHIVGPPYKPLYFAVDTTAVMQQRSLIMAHIGF